MEADRGGLRGQANSLLSSAPLPRPSSEREGCPAGAGAAHPRAALWTLLPAPRDRQKQQMEPETWGKRPPSSKPSSPGAATLVLSVGRPWLLDEGLRGEGSAADPPGGGLSQAAVRRRDSSGACWREEVRGLRAGAPPDPVWSSGTTVSALPALFLQGLHPVGWTTGCFVCLGTVRANQPWALRRACGPSSTRVGAAQPHPLPLQAHHG